MNYHFDCDVDGLKSKPKGECVATVFSNEEVWLPVPNYPRYEVSNMGGLRRLPYTDNLGRKHKLQYIKGRISSRIGIRVILCNGTCIDKILARIVATTFYGYDLDTELTVNHIDGNRYNNDINNLELITREENSRHAHEHGLHSISKPMTLKDLKTGNIYHFKSQTEASRFMGKNVSYIANAKRDGRMVVEQYQIGG